MVYGPHKAQCGSNHLGRLQYNRGKRYSNFSVLNKYASSYPFAAIVSVVSFNGTNDLLTNPNNQIEYSRSYICNSDTQLDFEGVDKIYPVVAISNLQVQAFQFNNNTSGAFDNGEL